MRIMIRTSIIWVLGYIWQPWTTPCRQKIELDNYQVQNARDKTNKLTRESVLNWLNTNTGDFREIIDFSASLEDGNETIDIPWAKEENGIEW